MLSGPPAAGSVEPPRHTQIWFGPVDRPLYGWLSMPAGAQARGGVVLCPPMGEEGRAAHRTMRRLAESLADVGLIALRFDYDGTGDSAGMQDDPDRVPSWLASIEAGRQLLLDLGVPGVSAVGMRLGATLAACHAGNSHGFDSLVLWDPCLSGRTFLREGEALFSFGDDHGEALDPAYRHTPGFQYDHDTAKAMRGIDLARVPTDRPIADRVLLLSRTDRPQPPGIAERLDQEGERLEQADALDQDLLLDLPPSDCLVPQRSLERVVSWLGEGVDDVAPVPAKVPDAEGPVLLASAGPGSMLVRERGVHLGVSGLYGIVDEPAVDPDVLPGAPRPWIVMVNVAAEHHIGPGRRWVEFARRWAGMGYRSVRLDQSGIGDSPSHPGQREDEPFAPEWIDDMRQVVQHLAADGSPVLMVGLCSGAYSAFEAAMWEPVTGVFAVNPRLTLYPAAKGTRTYTDRRRAAILPVHPVAALARHRRILAGAIWRIYRQVAFWHAPLRILNGVVRRGTVVHVVACHDDAQHFTEVVLWRPCLWRMRRSGRFTLEQDEIFDHSLLGRHGQEVTWRLATEFVTSLHAGPP